MNKIVELFIIIFGFATIIICGIVKIFSPNDVVSEDTAPVEVSTVIVERLVPVVEERTVIDIQTVEVYPVDYEQLQHMREDYYEMSRKLEDVYNELALKYQYSTYLWFRLKNMTDLNDYAIAGIFGNVMNECGGNTLDINPYALNKSRTHYGICQWSIEYHPDVFGRDIDSQIEYLVATIREIFDTYGYLYKKGFTYADFCSIGNVDEAADAFRIIYERPGRGTEATRRYNARLAYCTFVH